MSFFRKIVLGALLLAGLAAVGPARPAHAEAMDRPANVGNPVGLSGPEQRIALVIGNSNYQNVARLPNPANDAKAVAELLNTAGFEVISATDLNHNQMIEVMQDFSAKIAGRGANTVAMVYYAGHGVQLAGENYLVPVDARISSEPDLIDGSVRLVDVMATLEAIPSRMRIVILRSPRSMKRAADLRSSMRRTVRSSAIQRRQAPKRSTAWAITVPIPMHSCAWRMKKTCRSSNCSSAFVLR